MKRFLRDFLTLSTRLSVNKMKKLVLFDFDGTIVDNSEGIYNCIGYALEKKGLPALPTETKRKFIGPSLFDSFMWHCTDKKEEAEELVALYRERYRPVGTTEVRVYDGIRRLLEELKNKGIICAVCSSKPYEFVRKIAKEQGLEQYFDGFFCPGFGSHISDKSGLALAAMKEFSAEKCDTVFVGDTRFDVAAARDAGIECIGVLYGFSEEGELDTADYKAADATQIFSFITGEKQ